MAQRRMFHLDVVGSDRFLDLSPGAQLLYFHLGMQADDDGFVNGPKQICRMLRRPPRDLQALVSEGFLLNFDGIVVIKHFRVANNLKNDRRKPLAYPEVAKKLLVLPNRCYSTDLEQDGTILYDMRKQELDSKLEKSGIHLSPEPNRTEPNLTEPNLIEDNLTEESLTECPSEPADQLRFMQGRLGKGVLLLSDDQIENLLDKMGLDAFDFYTERLADYILKKKVKVSNHYATILQWYEEDKEVLK